MKEFAEYTLQRVAINLLGLSRQVLIEAPKEPGQRPSKAWAIANAKYQGALDMASIVGLGMTPFDVQFKVNAAAEIGGTSWHGRAGAVIDSDWLKRATDRLVELF